MSHKLLRCLPTLLPLALPAAAQTSQDAPTLQALLAEVRQLRLALERSATLSPRIQLTMQRVRLQDEKVARVSAQLEAVRREIANHPVHRATQQLTLLEQHLSSESDAARRKELEQRRAELRVMSAQAVDPQLGARESELANSLRVERAALDELSGKLDAMERLLNEP